MSLFCQVSLRSSHEIWQETRCAISALHKAIWLPFFPLCCQIFNKKSTGIKNETERKSGFNEIVIMMLHALYLLIYCISILYKY